MRAGDSPHLAGLTSSDAVPWVLCPYLWPPLVYLNAAPVLPQANEIEVSVRWLWADPLLKALQPIPRQLWLGTVVLSSAEVFHDVFLFFTRLIPPS